MKTAFLDEAHHLITHEQIEAGLELLHRELDARRQHDAGNWKRFVTNECRPHPLFGTLRQDPMTRHAVKKPRGYAGDAELMDFPYGLHPPLNGESELGRAIFAANFRHPVCRSVRERKTAAAHKIELLVQTRGESPVVSIACGHLREALECPALLAGQSGAFTAFDQDARSLEVVRGYELEAQLRVVRGSIRALLGGKAPFEPGVLMYSLGLYDYLEQNVAARLTVRLFASVQSGGSLWLANFARNYQGAGYMEAFMDWWLIGRDQEQMVDLCCEIEPAQIQDQIHHTDDDSNVRYLEIIKSEEAGT